MRPLLLLVRMPNGSRPEFFHLSWATRALNGGHAPVGDDLDDVALADPVAGAFGPFVPGVDAVPGRFVAGRVVPNAEREMRTSNTSLGGPERRVSPHAAEQGEAFGLTVLWGCASRRLVWWRRWWCVSHRCRCLTASIHREEWQRRHEVSRPGPRAW